MRLACREDCAVATPATAIGPSIRTYGCRGWPPAARSVSSGPRQEQHPRAAGASTRAAVRAAHRWPRLRRVCDWRSANRRSAARGCRVKRWARCGWCRSVEHHCPRSHGTGSGHAGGSCCSSETGNRCPHRSRPQPVRCAECIAAKRGCSRVAKPNASSADPARCCDTGSSIGPVVGWDHVKSHR